MAGSAASCHRHPRAAPGRAHDGAAGGQGVSRDRGAPLPHGAVHRGGRPGGLPGGGNPRGALFGDPAGECVRAGGDSGGVDAVVKEKGGEKGVKMGGIFFQ